MRQEIIVALTLIVCCSSAVAIEKNSSVEDNPVVDALKSAIVSSSDITSYRFTLDMDQTMRLHNLSNQTEAPQVLQVKSFGAGSVNVTEKAMEMALASVVISQGDEDNVTATSIEEYLINDTVYMKIDGNWSYMSLSLPGWTSQQPAGEQMEMLNQSKISLLGMESIDGIDCYKIGVVQDSEAVSRMVSQQDGLEMGTLNLNLSEIYRNATISMIYWIDTNENLLKKTEMDMDISINSKDLGIPAEEAGDLQIQMSIKSTYLYRDLNGYIQIALPSEAETAQPFGQAINITAEGTLQNTTIEANP